MRMDRREFLALCGVGLGTVAGCAGNLRDGVAESPAPSPGPTDTPPGRASPTSTPIDPLDGSWESYRHDAGNTAGTDDPGPTEGAAGVWRRATTTGDPATGPAAADGAFVVVTTSGVVFAREAADGAVRWSRPWPADIGVAPVASGGTVVLADGDTLVGLTAETGEERWRTPLDGSVVGLATTDGGVVAATGRELVTMAPGDGAERWRHAVDGTVVTPPGVGDGTVAVGLSSGDVLAVTLEPGERRWRTGIGAEPRFAPAVGHGHVYVESGPRLVALDGENGTQGWQVGTDYTVAAPPVTTADGVYLATLNEDAEPAWTGTPRPGATGTPTPVGEDTMWLEADLISLSTDDGTERWRTGFRETYSFTSGPPEELPLAATDDLVLLGLVGDLLAHDAATGERAWEAAVDSVTPAMSDGVLSTGRVGIDLTDGSVRWRFRTGRGVNAAPAVVGNTVYAGSDDHYLYALSANTGAIEWAVPTEGLIRASPAVGEDAVYVGTQNGSLYAFDRSDGAERWRADLGGRVQSPTLADGTVYVGNFSQTLFAVDAAAGTERWRTEVDAEYFVTLETAVGDGAVYAGANGDLRAFETADGSQRWRVPAEEQPVVQSSPAVADGRVFVNMGGSIRAFDSGDGSERWSRTTGGSHHPPAVHDGTVYAPGDGTLYAFDDDGTERWRTGVVDDLMLAVGDGTVFGMGYDTPVLALDPSDGSVLWRYGDFRGTTSPALADEYLFLGDDTGRVRAIGPESG